MSKNTGYRSVDWEGSEPRINAEFGGPVDTTLVRLGIYGADLDPDEITQLLGIEPTTSHRRGEARRSAGPWPQGAWLLKQAGARGQDPAQIVNATLDKLPEDPEVWSRLRGTYEVRLTFGLHLDAFNRGFDLAPEVVERLASIGAIVGFDIYCEADVDAEHVTLAHAD
jgi:hypothetical protein